MSGSCKGFNKRGISKLVTPGTQLLFFKILISFSCVQLLCFMKNNGSFTKALLMCPRGGYGLEIIVVIIVSDKTVSVTFGGDHFG